MPCIQLWLLIKRVYLGFQAVLILEQRRSRGNGGLFAGWTRFTRRPAFASKRPNLS